MQSDGLSGFPPMKYQCSSVALRAIRVPPYRENRSSSHGLTRQTSAVARNGTPQFRADAMAQPLTVVASQVMLCSGSSVSDVAYACGFCDQSHLNRMFKKAVGVPPGQYVRQVGLRLSQVASGVFGDLAREPELSRESSAQFARSAPRFCWSVDERHVARANGSHPIRLMRTQRLFSLLALVFSSALPAQGTTYLIDNVNVVDVAAGRVNERQRVVVSGSRITAVGTSTTVQAPNGVTVVDGTGKFLDRSDVEKPGRLESATPLARHHAHARESRLAQPLADSLRLRAPAGREVPLGAAFSQLEVRRIVRARRRRVPHESDISRRAESGNEVFLGDHRH